MQGFAADPVYAKGEVFAYVGLPQTLKDLKDRDRGLKEHATPVGRWTIPKPTSWVQICQLWSATEPRHASHLPAANFYLPRIS